MLFVEHIQLIPHEWDKSTKGTMMIFFLIVLTDLQTINDVFLGVTAAGLSRYLNRRHGEILNIKISCSILDLGVHELI